MSKTRILIIIVLFLLGQSKFLFSKFWRVSLTYDFSEDNAPAESATHLIFQDDFESYPVNTFPTGYTLTYNGAGDSYQKITDTQAASGTQSFTLTGASSWIAAADREIQYTSNILILEANLMSETPTGIVEGGKDNSNIKISFSNPTAATWGRNYASLLLRNDGQINLESTSPYIYMGNYTPFTWYNVKMVVNLTSWSVKAYLNDVYKGETSTIYDPAEITHVRIISAHQGITGYIDDIICSEELGSHGDDYINIITPANKTYFEPMSGYYPATYGFESEYDDSLPSYLTLVDTYPISVISSRTGHNKVLWFDDNGYSYRAGCSNYFNNNISSGTIEYWFLVDDAYDRTVSGIRQGTNYTVNMGSRYDLWRYNDGVTVDLVIQQATGGNMPGPLDNTWHHIKISFECTLGNYMGLDQYTWKCWINGIESTAMPFYSNEPYTDNFYMATSTAHTTYNMYIDAIGYSWEPDYDIGDNLKEGLLLGFTSNVTLDWIGYSLDGTLNKTIIGNTTISFPNYDGLHSIQVCGNDTLGTMYKSDIRYFTTQVFNLITPENVTYTEPMSGYYPATYGFENDADGADPEEWLDASGVGSDVQVISNFLGHNKVLRGYDGGGSSWKIENNITAREGTIELWWAVSSITGGDSHQVNVRDGYYEGEFLFSVGCLDGQIRVLTSGDWYDIPGLTTTANTWDHVRIDFRSNSGSPYNGLNTNEFKLYYNGVNQGTFAFNKTGDSSILRIYSGSAPSDHYGYYDAIGYSWDPSYTLGDNLEEGLLLGFDTSFSLDWLGYSLDGELN
ncbi:MAG: hypothetical protein ACFFA3_18890, partial [Promethearchaeota archaeon]